MEILGLDPKITICKIVVLPIKLCPLVIKPYYICIFIHKKYTYTLVIYCPMSSKETVEPSEVKCPLKYLNRFQQSANYCSNL